MSVQAAIPFSCEFSTLWSFELRVGGKAMRKSERGVGLIGLMGRMVQAGRAIMGISVWRFRIFRERRGICVIRSTRGKQKQLCNRLQLQGCVDCGNGYLR